MGFLDKLKGKKAESAENKEEAESTGPLDKFRDGENKEEVKPTGFLGKLKIKRGKIEKRENIEDIKPEQLLEKPANIEEPEEFSKSQLDVEDIGPWFGKQFSGKIQNVNSEIERRRKQILESLPGIKAAIQKLESAKFEEKFREDALANSIKESYVSRSLSTFNKFPIDHNIEDFNERVFCVLNEIGNPNQKELYVLSNHFDRESKDFKNSVKSTQDMLNKLNMFILDEGQILALKKDVDDLLKKHSEKTEETRNLESKILEKERSMKELKSTIDELQRYLEGLRKSDKAKRHTELTWGIEIFDNRIAELERFIGEQLSFLKRPVEKMLHAVELLQEDGKAAEKFSQDPIGFFLQEPDEVGNLLELVKKNFHLLELKESDIEKVKNLDIQKLLEMRGERLEQIKKREEARKSLEESDLKKDIENLESRVESTRKELEEHEKEREQTVKLLADVQKDIEDTKGELKRLVEGLGVETSF